MRLISFERDGAKSWGAITPSGVVDLGARLAASGLRTLRDAIHGGAIADLSLEIESNRNDSLSLEDIKLLPVIPDPGQILCIGLNYEEHRLETRREKTGHPTVFARFAPSQVGHGEAIIQPTESVMLDYEGELAIIIGQSGRRISEANAMSHVAGYACYNDVSVRDFQRHSTQFHPGKNFPATGAFGPWMVTADEIGHYSELSIETRLNGEIVQAAKLDQLIFTIPELIAYCSTFCELSPGDVIVTGTPGGVGSGREPPLWMKPGDIVEVSISGVGSLRNQVVAESALGASKCET